MNIQRIDASALGFAARLTLTSYPCVPLAEIVTV